MDIETRFTTNLKYFRLKKNYSQGDLAKAIPVTQQAVSYWERGEKTPPLKELPRIAKALDISIITLLGLDIEEKPSKTFRKASDTK